MASRSLRLFKMNLRSYVQVCVGILGFLHFGEVCGTPSKFSLFQNSPYSGSTSRQRNKNWCAFVVHRNVSCAVVGATETVMEPHLSSCGPHQLDCPQRVMFHTRLRTIYKVGYKQVTELEWRCCPGFQGHDCSEVKDAPTRPQILEEPRQDVPSTNTQQQSVLGPEVFSGSHPWVPQRHGGQIVDPSAQTEQRPQESRRVHELEEEVERLSQTVLDLQAAMTSANANLRMELQEDASKIIENMLGTLRQPQDLRTGGTESILLPYDLRGSPVADELQNQVTHLSNTINTNTNSIQDLQVLIQNIDGQLHRLTEQTEPHQPSSTASPNECPCQTYVDEKLSALRKELLEGMDIKLSDLKNACDYKVMSVQEQCEEQETSYLSLAELLDSKETELRKEIQDLRVFLPNTTSSPELNNAEVQKLKDNQRILTHAIRQQNASLAQIDAQGHVLEMRVKGAEELCLNIAENLRGERHKEQEALANKSSHLLNDHDRRLEVLERRSDTLKDQLGTLTNHVNTIPVLNQSQTVEGHKESVQQNAETQEVGCRQSKEQVATMKDLLDSLDRRVAGIEGVCGRFEPMSDSLKRIKDGLNKHVNGLWTCVRQLNSTVRTHTRDINTIKVNSSRFRQEGIGTSQYTGVHETTTAVNVSMEGDLSLSQRPVIMSGEAGPPGTKPSLQNPQGTNGSIPTVTGYAGAPGYPQFPAGGFQGPDSVSAQIPLKTVQMATGEVRAMTSVAFSAGLTLVPFPGEMAIIRFNNVLLNDGGHYDPKTGVFTAPVDGRYLLSAVLTAQTGEQVQAYLSVANRNIQKLYTAGVGGGTGEGCVCGGSASVSLALNLKRGQRSGLVLTSGKLAISASSEILSSFSGVLLYPTVAKR